MAKKITPQETCMICGLDPCVCASTSKRKTLKDHPINKDEEDAT